MTGGAARCRSNISFERSGEPVGHGPWAEELVESEHDLHLLGAVELSHMVKHEPPVTTVEADRAVPPCHT